MAFTRSRISVLSSGRIAVTGLLVLAASAAGAQAEFQHMSGAGHDIRKITIADGIYQFMTMRDSYVRQVNSVVVVNQNDVLVFDTDTRPSSAAIIVAEVRRITSKPVRYIVNSHWHPDHWSGNEVYLQAFPGAEVIATDRTRQFMQNAASAWPQRFSSELKRRQQVVAEEIKTGKQQDGTALTPELRQEDENDLKDYGTFVEEATNLRRVYPTLTYTDKLVLYRGNREFRFMSIAGDAEDTTALYLPQEKILITGDAVSYPIPYVTPPPSRQLQSLKALAQLDFEILIPGHGPALRDRNFLNLEIALLESVIKGVQQELRKGTQTLAEVQKAVTVDELRQDFAHGDADLNARYSDRVKTLVKLAVREARDGQDLP